MSQPHGTWRETKRRRQGRSASVGRLMRGLLLLGIVAGVASYFAILFYRPIANRPPEARILAVVVNTSSDRGLEPIDFPESERALLPEGITTVLTQSHAASLRSLKDDLRKGLPEGGSLIVYFRGQGVAVEDEVYLSCSDSEATSLKAEQAPSDWIRVRDLIDQIQDVPARTRLILLDYGQISSLPEQGIGVNDVPAALNRIFKEQSTEKPLHLILSHGALELSQTDLTRRAPVFLCGIQQVFTETEAIDSNLDGVVSVSEFYRSLYQYCDARTRPFQDCRQTPLLFQPGQGTVLTLAQEQDPSLFAAVALIEKASEETVPASEEKQAAGKSTAALDRARGLSHRRSLRSVQLASFPSLLAVDAAIPAASNERTSPATPSPAPAIDSSPKAPAEVAPPPKPTKPETADKPAVPAPEVAPLPPAVPTDPEGLMWFQLERAWRSLGELKSRGEKGLNVTPVDFAPQHLHAVEEDLIQIERNIWTARELFPQRMSELANQFQQFADSLVALKKQILAGEPLAWQISSAEALPQMQQQWTEFCSSQKRQRLNDEFSKVSPDVRRQWNLLHDIQYQLPQLLRWHQLSSRTRATDSRPIRDLLESSLTIEDQFRSLQASTDLKSGLAAGEASRQQFERAAQHLMRAFEDQVKSLSVDLDRKDALDSLSRSRMIQDTLATSLVPIETRVLLLKRIRSEATDETSLMAVSGSDLHQQRLSEVLQSDPSRRRAQDHAELYRAFESNLRQHLSAVSAEVPAEAPLSQLLLSCSSCSEEARYQLALLTPNPGGQLLVSRCFASVRFPERPVEERLDLAAVGATVQGVSTDWKTIEVRLTRRGAQPVDVHFNVEYDREALQVHRLRVETLQGGGVSLDPENSQSVTLAATADHVLRFQVRATGLAKDRLTAKLKLAARNPFHSRSLTFDFGLPTPNRVVLITRSVHLPPGFIGEDIRFYPNRDNEIQCLLKNESGHEREFRVDLIESPLPFKRGMTTEELDQLHRTVMSRGSNLRTDLKILATAPSVKIGPLQNMDVKLLDPQSFQPPASPDAPPAPPAPPAEPAEPVQLKYGLLLVLREIGTPPSDSSPIVTVQPLITAHLHPRQYLEARAEYDPAARRVTAYVSPKQNPQTGRPDLQAVPHDWGTTPLKVRMSQLRNLPEGTPRSVEDDLSLENGQATVFVAGLEEGQEYRFALDVDGYPRAFVFKGIAGQTVVRPVTDLQEIAISAITAQGTPWRFEPQASRTLAIPANPESELKPREVIRPAFLAPLAPDSRLVVHLQADAPQDAFIGTDHADRISLELSRLSNNHVEFESDRQEQLTFLGVHPESGDVRVRCDVADLKQEFNLLADKDIELTISAAMVLGTSEFPAQSIKVALDGRPPEVKSVFLKPNRLKYALEENLSVVIQAEDLSAVETVSVLIRHAISGQSLTPEPLHAVRTGHDSWQVEISPAGHKLQAGQRYQIFATLTDQVGNKIESKPVSLEIAVPAPPAMATMKEETPAPEAPKKGVIKGRIVKSGRPQPRSQIKVDLVGAGKGQLTVDANGEFLFTEVSPGSYTLKATGNLRGVSHSGELTGVSPSPTDDPITVDLEVKIGN